ncbi:MAG: hypothetical protein PWP51_1368 [Clostridiales bacterium]|jgi:hypothetical protein|nr:hypothetical protein [Clostridiales bacterium]MDN5298815.1 hypothetical protein [Clostridiales bacterium]
MTNYIGLKTEKAAEVAAAALIAMTFLAIFAFGYAHNTVLENYMNNTIHWQLPLLEIGAWCIIVVLDALVAVALCRFFHTVDQSLAYWLGGLRLLYTLVLACAVAVLGHAYSLIFISSDASDRVLTQIAQFDRIWSIGLIIFGLHLILVGRVAMKAAFFPKWLAYLIVIAGFCYAMVHGLHQLAPNFAMLANQLEKILSLPMTAAEIGLALWLWLKGRKINSVN